MQIARIIALQVCKSLFRTRALQVTWLLFLTLLVLAGRTSYLRIEAHNETAAHYQQKARESWLGNPDKHPHRMAHYGSFGFRKKHPLAVFDSGIENFSGNVVFLEAHKQNTVNFSEASFSTGLIRFGDFTIAFLLQAILPLLLIFFGFGLIASDRENGTLKLYLSQGVSKVTLLLGTSVGLFFIALSFVLPAFLVTLFCSLPLNAFSVAGWWERFTLLLVTYIFYSWIICTVVVCVSALSKKARESLLFLLGVWLIWVIILPRSIQSIGLRLHPTPSKIAFEALVEKDLVKEGDSHDPNDPHFKHIKDSLLKAYQIDSVQQLPFNYSGYIGFVGEKISSTIYQKHLNRLFDLYQQQISYSNLAGFVNPFLSIRSNSMSMAATDFASYRHFMDQAELYRYNFTQRMNTLQMDLISNKKLDPKAPSYTISSKYWKSVKDFEYQFLATDKHWTVLLIPILTLLFWIFLSGVLLFIVARKMNIL